MTKPQNLCITLPLPGSFQNMFRTCCHLPSDLCWNVTSPCSVTSPVPQRHHLGIFKWSMTSDRNVGSTETCPSGTWKMSRTFHVGGGGKRKGREGKGKGEEGRGGERRGAKGREGQGNVEGLEGYSEQEKWRRRPATGNFRGLPAFRYTGFPPTPGVQSREISVGWWPGSPQHGAGQAEV